MFRKIYALLLASFLLFSAALPVTATQEADTSTQIIPLNDGYYLEIIITQINTRSTNTKTGTKIFNLRNSETDALEWQAVLTATFTYTGTSAACTGGNCQVTVYNNNWHEISNVTTIAGNAATTALTMGRKLLGVTVLEKDYTIRLTCDKYGILHG